MVVWLVSFRCEMYQEYGSYCIPECDEENVEGGENDDGGQAEDRVDVELGHVPVVGQVQDDCRRARRVLVSQDVHVVQDEAGHHGHDTCKKAQ